MSEFDKWFKEQERVLYKDDKWIAKKAWDARQAKIDELQKKYDELNNRATGIALDQMATAKLNYELQARIDRVVHILTYTNHASTPLCNELRDILKGNKDEN